MFQDDDWNSLGHMQLEPTQYVPQSPLPFPLPEFNFGPVDASADACQQPLINSEQPFSFVSSLPQPAFDTSSLLTHPFPTCDTSVLKDLPPALCDSHSPSRSTSDPSSPDSFVSDEFSNYDIYSTPSDVASASSDTEVKVASTCSSLRVQIPSPPALEVPIKKEIPDPYPSLATFTVGSTIPAGARVTDFSSSIPLPILFEGSDASGSEEKKKKRKGRKRKAPLILTPEDEEDDDDDLDTSNLDKKERNKLSAAKYRKRRKMYIGKLEQVNNNLQSTVDKQKATISDLSEENTTLKNQLAFFKKLFAQSNSSLSDAAARLSPTSAKQAGAFLFVLFSMFLFTTPFWCTLDSPVAPIMRAPMTTGFRDMDPSVKGYKGRVLLSINDVSCECSASSAPAIDQLSDYMPGLEVKSLSSPQQARLPSEPAQVESKTDRFVQVVLGDEHLAIPSSKVNATFSSPSHPTADAKSGLYTIPAGVDSRTL